MFQILKFTFFNVLLSLFDVLTDLSTCIFLWEEGHPAWALLTAFWMLMPFIVGVMDFFARWMTRHCLHNKLLPLQDHREMVEKRTTRLQQLQRICLGFLLWGCLSSSNGTCFYTITSSFPAFPRWWQCTTCGGPSSCTTSTTGSPTFVPATPKRCKKSSVRQERAPTRH